MAMKLPRWMDDRECQWRFAPNVPGSIPAIEGSGSVLTIIHTQTGLMDHVKKKPKSLATESSGPYSACFRCHTVTAVLTEFNFGVFPLSLCACCRELRPTK